MQHACQDYFINQDITGVPTFSLPALVPSDRGMRFDGLKSQWLLWGYMEGVYDRQGGRLGRHKVYSNNELLLLGRIGNENNFLAGRVILSVEPGTIGKHGYPLLFSTGYTANGITENINAYPPLDLCNEISLSYVHQNKWVHLYGYFGIPAAPVLNLLVQQRLPEFFMPTGSITHRYISSTDIAYGVGSAGISVYGWTIEGSGFTGKSQDERYWKIKKPHFDSFALRLSYCYEDIFSCQASYGHINNTDPVELSLKNKRFIVSAAYNYVTDYDLFTITAAYAHNRYHPGEKLNSALLEGCFIRCDRHILFGRYEYTQTDAHLAYRSSEHEGYDIHRCQKVGFGYRYQFRTNLHGLWSLGASFDVTLVPHELRGIYGHNPVSGYLFLRVDLA